MMSFMMMMKDKNKNAAKTTPDFSNLPPDWPVPVKPAATYAVKVNESVYQLCAPEGHPKLDIVFFHGLQIGDYKSAFLETWVSGVECWPQSWLSQDFPRARILSVSYDSSARRSKVEGRVDLVTLGEILVEDVICSAAVGQNCPVILVGHSLGGIVIKQLCLEAERNLNSHHSHRHKFVKRFLKHVRGIFYYSVPHGGSQVANLAKSYLPNPGPMLEYLTVLSVHTEEINDAFVRLRQARQWRAAAVVESLITRIGPFRAIVVTQDSASRDVDTIFLLEDDHVSICKPRNTEAPSYVHFRDFIRDVI